MLCSTCLFIYLHIQLIPHPSILDQYVDQYSPELCLVPFAWCYSRMLACSLHYVFLANCSYFFFLDCCRCFLRSGDGIAVEENFNNITPYLLRSGFAITASQVNPSTSDEAWTATKSPVKNSGRHTYFKFCLRNMQTLGFPQEESQVTFFLRHIYSFMSLRTLSRYQY